MRRAGRPRAVAALLALAVVLLTLFGAGARGWSARPHTTARSTVSGHGHRPLVLPLRQPGRDTEQHRRTVPAVMAAAATPAGPPAGIDPAGPDPQARPAAVARPNSRGPPAGT